MATGLSTPVALFFFNRPDTTTQVFAEIARARPQKLLLIADGPRSGHPDDAQRCSAARAVVERVDWPCEVLRNYSATNLGCRRRVSSGLNWVFEQVERAIILEDDILPHPTFFRFMEEMLENYCDDQRIGMITGFNPVGRWRAENQQYHFSYCGAIWGWASWRRMWRHYDVDMKLWADPNVRERIQNVFAHPELYKQRMLAYDLIYRGVTDTWDYQWSVARLTQSAMSVVPAVNLVRNIGIRPDATHTKGHVGKLDSLPVLEMTFPLRLHPWVMVDRDYDHAFDAALK